MEREIWGPGWQIGCTHPGVVELMTAGGPESRATRCHCGAEHVRGNSPSSQSNAPAPMGSWVDACMPGVVHLQEMVAREIGHASKEPNPWKRDS